MVDNTCPTVVVPLITGNVKFTGGSIFGAIDSNTSPAVYAPASCPDDVRNPNRKSTVAFVTPAPLVCAISELELLDVRIARHGSLFTIVHEPPGSTVHDDTAVAAFACKHAPNIFEPVVQSLIPAEKSFTDDIATPAPSS